MAVLNDILTKQENLSTLVLHDYFIIERAKAPEWRAEIGRLYSTLGRVRKYSVRTNKNDEITRVIRVK